ncbi:MAG: hypothetical protein NUK62_09000 [Tenericutes bacterium]|nr:hypothetical protein [Mycoplasmatota bacterium]
MIDNNFEIPQFEVEVTGSKGETSVIKYFVFGKYIIAVKLSKTGKFLGITEVQIDKDFRLPEQRIPKRALYNIGEYVPE